ncbi:MAG: hypothetical protein AB7G23_21090 [Vicinamibacterales bacterium]
MSETMTNLIGEEGESLLYVEPESHGAGEEGESLLYVEPETHGVAEEGESLLYVEPESHRPWGYDELSDLGDEIDVDLDVDHGWGDLDL